MGIARRDDSQDTPWTSAWCGCDAVPAEGVCGSAGNYRRERNYLLDSLGVCDLVVGL